MSDNFDPYFKWLGIPPEEQPPSHYRLLGVPVFVDDAEVISNAADQRMAHLKVYQTGKHAHFSQKILNEISVARGCLLDIARKAVYDAEVRKQLGMRTATLLPVGKAIPLVESAAASQTGDPPHEQADFSLPVFADRHSNEPTRSFPISAKSAQNKSGTPRRKQKRNHAKLNVIAHIVAPIIALSLGAVIFFIIRGSFSDRSPAQVKEESSKSGPSTGSATVPLRSAQTLPVAKTTADYPKPNTSHQSATRIPAVQVVESTDRPAHHGSPNLQAEPGIHPLAAVGPVTAPSPSQVSANKKAAAAPDQEAPTEQRSGASAIQANGASASLSMEAETQVLEDRIAKATDAAAFRSVAELGLPLLRQAISENRKSIAQRCANVSLAAARKCDCKELLREITLLILDVQQMESK